MRQQLRRRLSLSHRIVSMVGVGLGLTLLLTGLMVVWTIRESTSAVYRERVRLAEGVATGLSESTNDTLSLLQHEISILGLEHGRPLTAEQRRRLSSIHPRAGEFTFLAVAVTGGDIIWMDPTRDEIVSTNPLEYQTARLALSTGRPQVGPCLRTDVPDSSRVCLAAPFHDVSGRAVGVLLAGFNPSTAFPSFTLEDDDYNYLRIELLHSIGSPAAESSDTHSGTLTHEQLLAPLIAAQSAGYRIHSLPHEPTHVVAYAPVPLLPSWGVLVEEPKDAVVELPNQLRQRLVIFGAAILALAMVAAWFDVRQIVRPLRQLTVSADRFALGELGTPIYLNRNDELGILSSALETMRQRLRASLAEVEEWNDELERRVEAQTAAAEARNRELVHLNMIAETVSGSLDQRPMLDETLSLIMSITGADAGCFVILNDDGALNVVSGYPATLTELRDEDFLKDDLSWLAIRRNDVVATDRDNGSPAGLLDAMPSLAACLAVPLQVAERVQGVLLLAGQRSDHFVHQNLATLSTAGRQVGMALANARLYVNLSERDRERAALLQRVMDGQEEERRRLAQELHDETSQALASLQFGLDRLAADLEADDSTRQLARELQGVAAATLAEVHRLAVELRPSVLDDVGLVAAVEHYLRECSARSGLKADFAVVGVEHLRLIPAAESATYRIIQGALTNVIQHANAQHISVLLERRGQKFVVIVEDDGCGFDVASVRTGALENRLGLVGMEERASLLGATLTIETAPGAGATIFLEIPLDQNCLEEGLHDAVAHLVG